MDKLLQLQNSWFSFWTNEKPIGKLEIFRKVLFFVLAILLYWSLRVGLFRLTTLAEHEYFEDVLVLEVVAKFWEKPYFLVLLLLMGWFFRKVFDIKWHSFEEGTRYRNFVCFVAFALTWMFTFYDYNYYLGTAHLLDRFLILLLILLSYWRPFFLLPFITIVLTVLGQMEIVNGFSIANPLLLIHIIIASISLWAMYQFTGVFRFTYLVFFLGCIIATDYVFSGAAKFLNFNWFLKDKIQYVLPNSYSIGWLNFLDKTTIHALTQGFGWLNLPLKAFTLLFECGLLFFFWRLRAAKILLFSALVFHTGIFFLTGISFWSWMWVHIGLLFFVLRSKTLVKEKLFGTKTMLVSIVIIILGFFWNSPVYLTWLDVPMNYSFRYVAETDSGKVYSLSPDFFSPYDYQFTLSRFNYLENNKRLALVGGSIGRRQKEIFDFFDSSHTVSEIFEFEEKAGKIALNHNRKQKLERFIVQFVQNRNKKANTLWIYKNWLKSPDVLQQGFGKKYLPRNERIKTITILSVTTYYSAKDGYQEIRQEPIFKVFIPNDN